MTINDFLQILVVAQHALKFAHLSNLIFLYVQY